MTSATRLDCAAADVAERSLWMIFQSSLSISAAYQVSVSTALSQRARRLPAEIRIRESPHEPSMPLSRSPTWRQSRPSGSQASVMTCSSPDTIWTEPISRCRSRIRCRIEIASSDNRKVGVNHPNQPQSFLAGILDHFRDRAASGEFCATRCRLPSRHRRPILPSRPLVAETTYFIGPIVLPRSRFTGGDRAAGDSISANVLVPDGSKPGFISADFAWMAWTAQRWMPAPVDS